MELKLATTVPLGKGKMATAVHTPDNKFRLLYVDPLEETINAVEAETPLGVWENLTFSQPEKVAPDTDVEWIDSDRVSHYRDWYFWGTGEHTFNRMATDPDDGPMYTDSPYRLYYGVDSEMLYMNISEYWTFIGSPNITKLTGYSDLIARIEALENRTSTYDDTEIRNELSDHESRIATLESNPSSGAYDDSALVARISALEDRVTALETVTVPTPKSWRILLITEDITNSAATGTVSLLQAQGHTLTSINESAVASQNLAGFDLIALDRYNSTTWVDTIRNYCLANKVPLLLGYPRDGGLSAVSLIGIASGTTLQSTQVASDHTVLTRYHLITRMLSAGGTYYMPVDTNEFINTMDLSKAYVGTPLIKANNPSPAIANNADLIAVEAGTNLLDGVKSTARIAYAGMVYRGYNNTTKDIIDRLVRWLMKEDKLLQMF